MPSNLDSLCGKGFEYRENGSVLFTKYPVGVAIMELPFYATGRLFEQVFKFEGLPGFTKVNVFFRIFSALFYLFWGLYLLGLLLLRTTKKFSHLIALLIVLFCATNIGYFAIWQPAMSHLYSLFCLIGIVYLLEKSHLKLKELIYLSVLTALVFSIRNINIVLLGIIFIYYFYTLKSIVVQYRAKLIYGLICGFLVVLPWIIYKLYLDRHHITAYEGEGFIYWSNPKILEILFSSTNGIFTFTPWIVMLFLILFYYSFLKKTLAITGSVLILSILLIYGSWWCYSLGCGLGHRGFVEFLPFILLIIMRLIPVKKHRLFIYISLPMAIYSAYLSYHIPPCFDHTSNDWDYREFLNLF